MIAVDVSWIKGYIVFARAICDSVVGKEAISTIHECAIEQAEVEYMEL
jgi:hypothetical protein